MRRLNRAIVSRNTAPLGSLCGIRCAAVVGALALLACTGALAQVSTASLEVDVVDASGSALPGVTVATVNLETGLERTAVSDGRGGMRYLALPPGDYEIRPRLEGMTSSGDQVVTLLVGERARLRLVLQPQVAEALTVSGGAPLVDVYRLGSSTNVLPEQIESLPVLDRKLESLALLTPGVQRDRSRFFNRTGSPVMATGSSSAQAAFVVDGVDLLDRALGLARVRFGQDSIREFRVLNSFDAEIGQSVGGVLSVVTKSGGNELKGSLFAFYRGDSMRAQGAFELEDAGFSRRHLGLALGGAIRPDRTHIFVSGEHFEEEDTALFRPGGAFVDLAADIPHPTEQSTAVTRLDHQFSQSSSGFLKLNLERKREDNYQVGGVKAEDTGWSFDRDGWNVQLSSTRVLSGERLNELRMQAGRRHAPIGVNSTALLEWFSFGSTLQRGGDFIGEGCAGDLRVLEVADTLHWQGGGESEHALKAGLSIQRLEESYTEDRFKNGALIFGDDAGRVPVQYFYGSGSSLATYETNLVGLFIQDDWRPRGDLTISIGARYDIDTDGNNPDLRYELLPDGRSVDDDNFQLRLGFNWDASGDGRTVLRGGLGNSFGRHTGLAALYELQRNGTTGRIVQRRVNGAILGLPPAFWLDASNPASSGIVFPPDLIVLAPDFRVPESRVASLGLSRRLGSTGLVLDVEALTAEGRDEIISRDTNFGGNDNPVRLDADYFEIETFTNEARSRYSSLVVGINGRLKGGHLLSASVTVSDKKNHKDGAAGGRPSDPTDVEAEWGPSLSDERYRLIVSGVFKLPWRTTVSGFFEYGSGRPWNRLLGYDANGDLWASDRPSGVGRNDQEGPPFRQLNLRLAKTVWSGENRHAEILLEAYNLLNTTNYDVDSIDNAMFVRGVSNPRFGEYTATHEPRQIQVGVRVGL